VEQTRTRSFRVLGFAEELRPNFGVVARGMERQLGRRERDGEFNLQDLPKSCVVGCHTRRTGSIKS
jgi:hypothetical protein